MNPGMGKGSSGGRYANKKGRQAGGIAGRQGRHAQVVAQVVRENQRYVYRQEERQARR